MSKAHLTILGGIAAMLAGVLRGIAACLPGTVAQQILQPLYLCTDFFILLAIIVLYGHEHDRVGKTGFVGFLLAVAGILVIRSARAFAGVDLYPAGALIFSLGLIVLGLRLQRVGALPYWIVSLWILAFLIGIAASVIPNFTLLPATAGLLFAIGFYAAGRQLRLTVQTLRQ